MAKKVSIPPAGFEDLTPDEKVQYVQDLWDYVVADASKVPVPIGTATSSMSVWPNTTPLHMKESLGRRFASSCCENWLSRNPAEISRWPKSLSVRGAADIRGGTVVRESTTGIGQRVHLTI